jgi:hypothetical protein
VPGILLIVLWGFGSLVTLLALWLRPQWAWLNRLTQWTHEQWAWTLTVALGLALAAWLIVQLVTLPAVAPIQYVLFGLASLLVLLPMLPGMRDYYELREQHA